MSVRAAIKQGDIDRMVKAVVRAGYRPRLTMRGGEVIVEAVDSEESGVRDADRTHLERLLDRHAS